MVAVVNLGSGNLCSVENALAAVGAESFVAASPGELDEACAIVLPGVGAFGAAMESLRGDRWIDALERNVRERGKPFLGICLGMQLLASRSEEFGTHDGLGWIPGTIRRLPSTATDIRIPHIGWNDVRFSSSTGLSAELDSEESFYFVHSFALHVDSESEVKGTTSYGEEFVSCVEADNVWATQFHPEKSQRAGLQILRNFVGMVN